MKFLRPILFLSSILTFSLFSETPQIAYLGLDGYKELKQHALYLMQQNQIDESFDKYLEYVKHSGRHDFEVLRQMGLALLQKGIGSDDRQVFLMSLFGAGLSGSMRSLEILEKGIAHPDPQMQLISLHFLSMIQDDKTKELFNRAMSSDYLAIRMEAALCMARGKHPHAIGQIEGLMYRLPPVFKPYFPSLFALLGTSDASQTLRRLMEDPDPQTRIESILQAAKLQRDDFLPSLRKRLTHSHIAEVEAAIFAVSLLQDSHSIKRLERLTNSPTDTLSLAASLALFRLGDHSHVDKITQLAKKNNLFAIAALQEIEEGKEILFTLSQSQDLQVRMNAAISLLKLKDERCVSPLLEILILNSKDLAFYPFHSVGRTFAAIKALPSAQVRSNDQTVDLSYSLAMREGFLKDAMQLKETAFLNIVRTIFEKGQTDLIPGATALLENLQTENAIALLKAGTYSSFPLVRGYCHLSLFRLEEEGPSEEYLQQWVMNQKETELIQFKEIVSWKYRLQENVYAISPEETSRLFIDTFLSLVSRREEKSITFLLKAIQQGNPYNRYALMGLLMKSTE